MPRRNKPVKHVPFHFADNTSGKVRYGTKEQAEQAASLRMLERPGLELRAYRGIDGGWYLTRQKNPDKHQ